jgi:heme/copper-type cytochrome/quinol oxidase subunit 1
VHTLVRRYIKTAIGFLALGLAIGGWLIVRRDLFGRPPGEYEVSAHTHAIFVGFVMMMILGVALWLFPRPDKTDTRYRPALAEAAYWFVTIGTAVRVAGELLDSSIDAAWLRWAIVLAGLTQIGGFAVFFYTMWSRIRGVGSQVRESRGERF